MRRDASPRATACPKCSEKFDEPVPADAEIQRGFTAASAALHPSSFVPPPARFENNPNWLEAPVVLTPRRPRGFSKLSIAVILLLLAGFVLAGYCFLIR